MSVLKPASYFLQTTKAFLPTMLEINHGHIVTVASSLGLFSTAGVEVCLSFMRFIFGEHLTRRSASTPSCQIMLLPSNTGPAL